MAEKQRREHTLAASDFLKQLGPGLITGASDDDPSGIGTYSQAGAQLGFSIGWTMLLTFPLMTAIQEISARIGRTTGHGIAGNLRRHYSDWLLYPIVGLLFIANTINIGADLSAMGDALKLLVGGPTTVYAILFGTICAQPLQKQDVARVIHVIARTPTLHRAYAKCVRDRGTFVAPLGWGHAPRIAHNGGRVRDILWHRRTLVPPFILQAEDKALRHQLACRNRLLVMVFQLAK